MAYFQPNNPGYNYNNNYNNTPSAPPVPVPVPGWGQQPYQPMAPQSQQPYQPIAPQSQYQTQGGYNSFPPGTHPDIIRTFQMVDRDRSGFIDENELQQALSTAYQRFKIRTIRLLIFLFKNPYNPLSTGPKEFVELWNCLSQWRGMFERFDRDRSGKIDAAELRDALYSLGYAIPPSVLQVLISSYDDGSGRKIELMFDSFVECGMIVKGMTEKFKEKDSRYTGSVTFSYESFLSMIIPFLV